MLDFIYTLFIAPLEYWMHAVLVWGFDKTAHWGEAIILMSLAVNFVILPIYMKAESWQEEERKLRKSFEAKEKMIRRAFTGQERFAMISTMQRQAGYSPFLALRSSVGFFLQIPFFFAAYHFLSHFEPLNGVSFWVLTDLSKPDGLIRLGDWSVNVMPFVMTAVNLISALVYTKNLSRKDKIELYGMAAVFLVLLYDAASGLVLYWTCNNIFSLGKNICYEAAGTVKRRIPAGLPFAGKTPLGTGSPRLILVSLAFWAAGAAAALLSSNQITVLSEGVKAGLSSASDIAFLVSLALILVEIVRLQLWRGRKTLLVILAVILWYTIKTWYKWEFAGGNRHYWGLTASLACLWCGLILLNLRVPLSRLFYPKADPAKLFTPAAVWLVILVTGYLPVQAFCTAPEVFSTPDVVLAKTLLWGGILTVIFWCAGRLARAYGVMRFAGFTTTYIAVLFTLYAFILPLDVGTIDAFQIAAPARLYRDVNVALDVAVVLGVLWALTFVMRKGFVKQTAAVLSFCSVAGLAAAAVNLWQSQGTWQAAANDAKVELPEWNDRFFGFTKTGTNRVVVMLDAFTGGHIRQIADEHPEVAAKLAGFTWFSDATATGNSTVSSLPSILCGKACTPKALNEGETEALAEKINARYAETVRAMGTGTDVAVNERNWLQDFRLKRHLPAGADPLLVRHMGDVYLDRYVVKTGTTFGKGDSDVFLLAVSVFKAVPWSAKNLIYKDGRWIESMLADLAQTTVMRAMRDWALLTQLSEISNTRTERSTFKFIDLEITHEPWFMDSGECRIKPDPKRVVRADGIHASHLTVEVCTVKALTVWFDWMKREGVYDNTEVLLVSDHGDGDNAHLLKTMKDTYRAVGRFSALMLYKPVNAGTAPLAEDRAPVGLVNVGDWLKGKAPLNAPQAERFVYSAKPMTTDYDISRVWRVRGAADKAENWEMVKP